jgi:hypothetical protein
MRLGSTVSCGLLLVTGLLAGNFAEADSPESEPVHIGSRRELFVDKYLIDSLDNVRLVLHAPVDMGQVLPFNQPAWEEKHCTYATVLYSERGYQLYYRAGLGSDSDLGFQATAYAESADGIHWTKPALGLCEVAGNRNNNIILTNEQNDFAVHNFSPFIDTRSEVPNAERYKALGGIQGGLYAFVSADGIHWNRFRDQPVFTEGVFDSQNVSFWSEAEQCYLCYFRTWTGGGFAGYRTISRARSDNFIDWRSDGEIDFGSAPREHLYINQTAPYFRARHIYLGTAARLVVGREVLSDEQATSLSLDPKYREQTRREASDVVLLTSRGGRKMEREFLSSLIRPGIGYQNWISRSNFPALNLVPTGPMEMSLYVVQNYAQDDVHLRRYAFRLDGLASAQADANGGQLLTRPLTFSGTELRLNYSTSAAGSIRVEICDPWGNPIQGFSAADSAEIIGNEIERVVFWRSQKPLSDLAGKPVRLRFILKDADLFSFRFE